MFFFNNFVKAEYEKIFYDLKIESITGEIIDFKEYENKAVLVVNTASYCGFTCLLYTSPSPRDATLSRMPSSA